MSPIVDANREWLRRSSQLAEEVAEGLCGGILRRQGGVPDCAASGRGNELQGAEGDKKKLGEDGSELAQFHSRGTGYRVQGTGRRD